MVSHRDLILLAEAAQPGFEAILLAWWAELRPSLNATTDAIETGLIDRVLALMDDPVDSETLITALTGIGQSVSELVFTLDNPAVERWARQHVGEMVTQVTSETKQAIRDIVTDGFRSGKAPRAQARLIREIVGLTRRDAKAISRYRDGLKDAGMTLSRIDELTARRSKKYLARRAENIARTECLPGDTTITGARATAIYRRWYSGEWVEVITKSGRHIAGTPNHPVLTIVGWKGLGELTKSDRLICDAADVKEAGTSRDEDVQHRPATIREVFDAAAAVGIVERERTGQPDFHGDGREGYVDVLRPDGILLIGEFAPVNERRIEGVLAPSLVRAVAVAAFGAPFRRGLGVAEGESFAESTMPDSGLVEDAEDNIPVYTQSVRDSLCRSSRLVVGDDGCGIQIVPSVVDFVARSEQKLAGVGSFSAGPRPFDNLPHGFPIPTGSDSDSRLRHAGPVEVDDVCLLVRRQWSGHVFNISTADGYFAANEVYTGNTVTAANRGQLEAWRGMQDAGLLPQDVQTVWIAEPGSSRTCPLCLALDGAVITLGESYYLDAEASKVGPDGEVLETKPIRPITTQTPALHPGCRCTTGIV